MLDPDVLRRLERAREYIDDCFQEQLDLDLLAHKAFFSRYHFLRLFRQVYHQTPHQYLMKRRVEKAKDLLITGTRPVTDICFDVGFQSLGSFSTLFRRMVGASPLDYRARIVRPISLYRAFEARIPTCFITMHGYRPLITPAK
jgi:AraC-like DNA-binding protein